MSRGVNRVILVGNTGDNPEIRATSSGKKVAKLSLATNRSWKDGAGNRQEDVQWHRLTLWSGLADIAEQWVKKGDRLYVEGRIQYSETVNDAGEKRFYTDIIVDELIMLGSPDAVSSGSVPQERTPF